MKFEDFKNELNSENVSLKADNDRLKIQVMEQSREEGLNSLKVKNIIFSKLIRVVHKIIFKIKIYLEFLFF